MTYHIAQFNIGRFQYPLDDPRLESFTSQLDEINALAEAAPGFVWRLQGDSGNAMDVPAYSDPRLLVNMSVWEDADSLFEYTYHSDHVRVFADRARWFEKRAGKPALVLWWVPAGHLPSVEKGKQKLDYLEQHGPSAEAFTLKRRFSPPT